MRGSQAQVSEGSQEVGSSEVETGDSKLVEDLGAGVGAWIRGYMLSLG